MTKIRYLYKLRPSAGAQTYLRAEYGRTRWLWNQCVDQYRAGNKPTAAKLDKLLTEARRANTWLREGSSVVQQQAIRDYAKALDHSFSVPGRGRPVYKSRKKHPYVSLNYTRRGFSLTEGDRPRLRLPGGVTIPVVWSRDLPSEPTSVRVYEDAAGWWWASFVVEAPEPETPEHPAPDATIGVDWGIRTTATTTDPDYDLPYRATAAEQARRIKRYQRRMSRNAKTKSEECKARYSRDKKRYAREHRRVRWQRQEHARAWAQSVARGHGKIAVEDFKPKFLAKTSMAKKMHNAAIGQLKRDLINAADKVGSEIVLVNPAYTTMTCSSCWTRAKSKLPLNQRIFRCDNCGHTEDRDRNASKVVVAQAGFNLAFDDGCETSTPSGGGAS